MKDSEALFQFLLELGDDRLVLGHRLSEWCGHGPFLEEDIALTNIALDLVGQAKAFLDLAGEMQSLDSDTLAYHRDETAFCCAHLVEQPRGDFAYTVARQFLFDVYSVLLLEILAESSHEGLAAIAGKSLKEERYHQRHSTEWVLRLGDGTQESRSRIQLAFDDLWMFTEELFVYTQASEALQAQELIPSLDGLRAAWTESVSKVLKEATLETPSNDQFMAHSAREGKHSEHLGHLLAEMQVLPRSYPGAKWG
jgi:ring-1,2-phenylacetyl-CoA epoxidase subunit PaaC